MEVGISIKRSQELHVVRLYKIWDLWNFKLKGFCCVERIRERF
jgi:hypothetical protein